MRIKQYSCRLMLGMELEPPPPHQRKTRPMRIANDPPTEINGYDSKGVFVGSAQLDELRHGGWVVCPCVVTKATPIEVATNQHDAEVILEKFGAVRLIRRSGRKY